MKIKPTAVLVTFCLKSTERVLGLKKWSLKLKKAFSRVNILQRTQQVLRKDSLKEQAVKNAPKKELSREQTLQRMSSQENKLSKKSQENQLPRESTLKRTNSPENELSREKTLK